MGNKYSELFNPIVIGGVEIKNRFFMAPMGNFGYTDEFGAPTQTLIDYFTERAKGGMGLLFTGFCVVDENIEKVETPSILVIKEDPTEFIKKASLLTEKVHAYDSKIFLQLTAGFGRGANIVKVNKRIAPSDIANKHDKTKLHKEMTLEEINNLVEAFGRAALIAKKCGFDGVEVHAIHEGYLLDQFTVECTNHRTDKYGGTREGRYSISSEIVKSIKEACGEKFPVSVRYTVKHYMKSLEEGMLPEEADEAKEYGRDIEEGILLAKYLEAAGYDALNVDIGSYESHYLSHPNVFTKDALYLDVAEVLTKEVNIPILVAGRMDNPDLALDAVATNKCDMVGLGRPSLADPYIVNKIKNNEVDRIRHCISCNYGCITNRMKHNTVMCAINPQCYMERTNSLNPLLHKKRVVVIGGGPAGMQAALTAAMRGHIVTLYEKSSRLGGNMNYGGAILYKHHILELIKWFNNELNRYGVDIRLNTNVDDEFIKNLYTDVLIVATGSNAKSIEFEGSDSENVAFAHDSYFKDNLGDNIVLVGAGAIGMETAIWLSKANKKVSVVEFTNNYMGGKGNVAGGDYTMVRDYIKYYNINMNYNSLVTKFENNTVYIQNIIDSKISELPADNVILSVGYNSNNELYKKIRSSCSIKEIYNVGDSKDVANIYFAIHDAYEIANNI